MLVTGAMRGVRVCTDIQIQLQILAEHVSHPDAVSSWPTQDPTVPWIAYTPHTSATACLYTYTDTNPSLRSYPASSRVSINRYYRSALARRADHYYHDHYNALLMIASITTISRAYHLQYQIQHVLITR